MPWDARAAEGDGERGRVFGHEVIGAGGAIAQLFSAGATAPKADASVAGKVETTQAHRRGRMRGYEGGACTE